jgi:hypothetical protein
VYAQHHWLVGLQEISAPEAAAAGNIQLQNCFSYASQIQPQKGITCDVVHAILFYLSQSLLPRVDSVAQAPSGIKKKREQSTRKIRREFDSIDLKI